MTGLRYSRRKRGRNAFLRLFIGCLSKKTGRTVGATQFATAVSAWLTRVMKRTNGTDGP